MFNNKSLVGEMLVWCWNKDLVMLLIKDLSFFKGNV